MVYKMPEISTDHERRLASLEVNVEHLKESVDLMREDLKQLTAQVTEMKTCMMTRQAQNPFAGSKPPWWVILAIMAGAAIAGSTGVATHLGKALLLP